MIDFHSHILPGIDDGAENVEESLALLTELKKQGVDTVVATPHFIGRCSIGHFLRDRQKAYDVLKEAMDKSGGNYPSVVLGAEVAVNEFTLDHHAIDRLCIEGTNYILAEMPDDFWAPFLYHVVYTLMAQYQLKIIIAHIDRYYTSFGRNEKILKLVDMQPVFQINTPSLRYRKGKKLIKLLELLRADFVFGSDCHNTDDRNADYGEPLKILAKKYKIDCLNNVKMLGENIINNK